MKVLADTVVLHAGLTEHGNDLVGTVAVVHVCIEDADPQAEDFDAMLHVLAEYVRHHVKEEEGEMFPQLKRSDVDLAALGAEMDQRKQEGAGDLMHEFDPVNAARVIKIVIDGSGARVESDSDSADSECDVPNEMADVRRPKEEDAPEDVEPKVKAPKKDKTASVLQLDNEKIANRRRKVSGLLENQALELEQSFENTTLLDTPNIQYINEIAYKIREEFYSQESICV